LQWTHGTEKKSAELEPALATDWFNPDRGLAFEPLTFIETAHTFGDMLRSGGRETANAAMVVFRTIQKIGSNQVSARLLGGPVTIFQQARHAAEEGVANLLLFLTLLSANLAVLNFLPIPLLDGGHFILLVYEGIRGKPADERVQEILTYVGLIFILGLMCFVLGLEFGWIPRPGAH
jgi:regulator of sigma E protease